MSSLINFYKNKTINNTTLFLIPFFQNILKLTSSSRSFLKYISDNGYINSYIDDLEVNIDNLYPDCMFIYFDYRVKNQYDLITFNNVKHSLHDWIIKKEECVDYIENPDTIVYVLKYTALENDFKKIISGNYSEFPKNVFEKYDNKIKKEPLIDYHLVYLNNVINKTDQLKNLIKSEFRVNTLSNLHSNFNVETDYYYGGEHQKFDYQKSNLLFKNIIRELN